MPIVLVGAAAGPQLAVKWRVRAAGTTSAAFTHALAAHTAAFASHVAGMSLMSPLTRAIQLKNNIKQELLFLNSENNNIKCFLVASTQPLHKQNASISSLHDCLGQNGKCESF